VAPSEHESYIGTDTTLRRSLLSLIPMPIDLAARAQLVRRGAFLEHDELSIFQCLVVDLRSLMQCPQKNRLRRRHHRNRPVAVYLQSLDPPTDS
jgi:hypothetical protein